MSFFKCIIRLVASSLLFSPFKNSLSEITKQSSRFFSPPLFTVTEPSSDYFKAFSIIIHKRMKKKKKTKHILQKGLISCHEQYGRSLITFRLNGTRSSYRKLILIAKKSSTREKLSCINESFAIRATFSGGDFSPVLITSPPKKKPFLKLEKRDMQPAMCNHCSLFYLPSLSHVLRYANLS